MIAGRNLNASSVAGDIAVNTLQAGQNLWATTQGGSVNLTNSQSQGKTTIKATRLLGSARPASNIAIGNLLAFSFDATTSDGGITIASQQGLRAGTVNASQDITLLATIGDITADSLTSYANINVDSQLGTVGIQSLLAKGNTSIHTKKDTTLGNVIFAGNLTITADAGAVGIANATVKRDANLTADTLRIGAITAGNLLRADARNGSVSVNALHSLGNATIAATQNVTLGCVTVGKATLPANLAVTASGNLVITLSNVSGTTALTAGGTKTVQNVPTCPVIISQLDAYEPSIPTLANSISAMDFSSIVRDLPYTIEPGGNGSEYKFTQLAEHNGKASFVKIAHK